MRVAHGGPPRIPSARRQRAFEGGRVLGNGHRVGEAVVLTVEVAVRLDDVQDEPRLPSETRNSCPVAVATSQPWTAVSLTIIEASSAAGIFAIPRSTSPSHTEGSFQAATARSSWAAYASAQSGSAVKSRPVSSSESCSRSARCSIPCEV